MSTYHRRNPDAPIQHDALAGADHIESGPGEPKGAMTPGPWQVLDRRHYDGTREDGNLTPWIIYGDGEPIARIVQEFVDGEHPGTHNEQRAEANARAIAALPELVNFAHTVARSACLDQRLGDRCICFACEAVEVLQKAGCL